jgi:hypothetical protein
MSACDICINRNLAYSKHFWVRLIILLYANPMTSGGRSVRIVLSRTKATELLSYANPMPLPSISCFMQQVGVPIVTVYIYIYIVRRVED